MSQQGKTRNMHVRAAITAFALIACLITGSLATVCVGQTPGSLDTTFDVRVEGTNQPSVPLIQSVAVQPDGKILIAGDFVSVNGVAAIDLARLNPDGSVDPSFTLKGGTVTHPQFPAGIRTIHVEPDGKIFVGGSFYEIGGVARTNLARLNPDGSVDTSFMMKLPGRVMPPFLEKFTKIGGGTTDPAYAVLHSYLRNPFFMNRDGSLDREYNAPLREFVFEPRQSSGKIIASRDDYAFYAPLKVLERLNPDGKIDPTFQNGTNFLMRTSAAVQPDDRILMQPATPDRIGPVIRLMPDGQLDTLFQPVTLDAPVSAFVTQPNGRIVMIGQFTNVNGVVRRGIARIYGDSEGAPIILNQQSETQTFVGQTARIEIEVSSALPLRFQWQYQGQDIIGATNQIFEIPNVQITQSGEYRVKVQNDAGTTISGVIRLTVFGMAAGALDTSFPGNRLLDGSVYSLLEQPDGKLLVGGSFTNAGGSRHGGIVRLLEDGNVDSTFHPGAGVMGGTNPHVRVIVTQADGRIMIGGQFTEVNGIALGGIGRLLENGTVDETFRPPPDPGPSRLFKSIAVQTNGQVLAGGTLPYVKNDPLSDRHLLRLNENGSLDASFTAKPYGSGCSGFFCWDYSAVNALLIYSDGKILAGGGFYGTIGDNQRGLMRLHLNGEVDTNFYANMTLHTTSEFDRGVPVLSDVVEQPEGKLIVVGIFSYYPKNLPDRTIHKLDRLNPDGSRDTNFIGHLLDKDLDGEILTTALQPDGKILVGGSFKSIKGVKRNNIARFNVDGTLDLLFDVGEGPDGSVHAIEVMKDGSIVIGGEFNHVNGIEQRGLARLFAHPDALPIIAQPAMKADGLEITWNTEAGQSYVLETTASLSAPQWSLVTNVTGDGALKTFKDRSRTQSQQYYRLRVSPN